MELSGNGERMTNIRKQMKRCLIKLRTKNGESLIEALAALMIAILSLGMLATAIITSGAVMKRSEAKLQRYYDAAEIVAGQEKNGENAADAKKGSVRIVGDSISYAFEIRYQTNDVLPGFPVLAYSVSDEDEP